MFLKLLTLALTALIVVPGGAHLFELPVKKRLGEVAYFSVRPTLRRSLEYGHAAITFVALLATGRAIIGSTP